MTHQDPEDDRAPTEDHGRSSLPPHAGPPPEAEDRDGEDVYLLDEEWVGRDYWADFTDRAVLSRRRGDRPPSRWTR